MDGIVSLDKQGRIGIIPLQEKMGPPIPTGDYGEIPHQMIAGVYHPGSNQHLINGKCTIEPFPNKLGVKPKEF